MLEQKTAPVLSEHNLAKESVAVVKFVIRKFALSGSCVRRPIVSHYKQVDTPAYSFILERHDQTRNSVL